MSENVRMIDDPVLREICTRVNLPNDHMFIVGLIETMNETMVASNGLGLAANQIGQPVQVFILKDGDSYREYINPEILSKDELVTFDREACLSIPGAYGPTKRYRCINLAWVDKNGLRYEGYFEDLKAFAVQHEMDHLLGRLYIDQYSPLMRKLTLKKHRKFLKEY
jgi:peptide deformylase